MHIKHVLMKLVIGGIESREQIGKDILI